MHKYRNLIISILGAIVIMYIVQFLFDYIKYSYSVDMLSYKSGLYIFKDSSRKDVDTLSFSKCYRNSDIIYTYHYKHNSNNRRIYEFSGFFNITIWEIKQLKKVTLKDILIKNVGSLEDVRFERGEILNAKSNPETSIPYSPFISDYLRINIDSQTKIDSVIEASNYKGFYGLLNKITLNNKQDKPVALIDYKKYRVPALFLLYKSSDSFYIIIAESMVKPFDKNIINIFDLKQ